jgi:hypothetical protein
VITRIVVIALLLGSSAAAIAAPIADCPATESIAMSVRTAAKLHTTYELENTTLRVCIDKAVYPYAAGRGHRLLACFTVATGGRNGRSKRVCGEGTTHYDFDGYRIRVSMRTPRFTESSDVWLEIVRPP